MFDRTTLAAAGMSVVLSAAASAWAGPIYWTNPAGSNSKVTYSDGQEDKGLYGDPTVVGNTFQFLTPHDFEADAANGSAETTSDRVSFKVATNQGALTKVNIIETGDWSILGGASNVKDTGGLFITRLDPGHFGVQYTLTPTLTYTDTENNITYSGSSHPMTDGSGTWKASYFLTLPVTDAHQVQLVLNNTLQATATAGATSFIQKKSVSITIVDPGTPTPEPASLGLLMVGATMMLRRRQSARA